MVAVSITAACWPVAADAAVFTALRRSMLKMSPNGLMRVSHGAVSAPWH